MANGALGRVTVPTLLIVGGHDEEVLALNQLALEQLSSEKQLAVVPGATHLFEEPGTLEETARLAAEWFARHLRSAS
jgi:pimeloyl-ACP methyl ester carboxylesterase